MIQPKRSRGRPKKPEEDRLVQRTVRMSPAQWRKIDSAGLTELRFLVDKWSTTNTPLFEEKVSI